jgi:hypothetical protein
VRLAGQTFWTIGQSFYRRGWIQKNGLPRTDEVKEGLKKEWGGKFMTEDLERIRLTCTDPSVRLNREAAVRAEAFRLHEWCLLAAYFERAGRQIFDLNDALVEELRHTDVHDATMEQLALPFDTFYVRFGLQSDLNAERATGVTAGRTEYVDGAFVWNVGPHVRVGLTTVLADGTGTRPGRLMDIPWALRELPCLDALEEGYRKQREFFVTDLSDTAPDFRRAMEADLDQGVSLLRAAMPLVLNSIFYLESLEKGYERSPGRDAPEERKQQWRRGTDENRRKLASRLATDGYAIVYMVGQEVAPAREAAKAGGLLRPHWRRGHWRTQRHGPQRSLVKRIRIKPTLVNADRAADELVTGHVYKV